MSAGGAPRWADAPAPSSQTLVVWRGLFPAQALQSLGEDARQARGQARRSEALRGQADEGRGGAPARACTIAAASAAHFALHDDPALRARLEAVAGARLAPTGGGSYTWYERPGDFLALHRDIDGCDATLVTCLAASPGAGALVVYPEGLGQPLSALRQRHAPGLRVALEPGDSALVLGGFVPHEVEPMAAGSSRLVSLMCFRFEDGPPRDPG